MNRTSAASVVCNMLAQSFGFYSEGDLQNILVVKDSADFMSINNLSLFMYMRISF